MRDLKDINEINEVLARNAQLLQRPRPIDPTGNAPRSVYQLPAREPRNGTATLQTEVIGYAPSLAVFKARERAINDATAYAGHAGSGGIQKHSLGDEYPWVVVGYGDGTWGAENVATGTQLVRRGTYKECQADIEAYKRLVLSSSRG